MLLHADYRQLVVKLSPARGPGVVRRLRFRDSLDTLVLGSLSTAIGIVLLIALASGIARRSIPGWNERAISTSANYYIPSKDCAVAALIGEGLGLAGITLARYRHNTISPLSALGTAISLLHVYVFFIHVSIMEYL